MKSFLKIMIVVMALITVAVSAYSLFVISDMAEFAMLDDVAMTLSSTVIGRVITYIVLFAVAIVAIVSIVGSDSLTSDVKGGVILPMTIGNVQISSQTFESIVLNVAKKYGSVKTNRVAIKMTDEGVLVDVYAYVLQDTIISDITEKLQEDIKETVLKQTTVAVKNVDVKIKGVYELNQKS